MPTSAALVSTRFGWAGGRANHLLQRLQQAVLNISDGQSAGVSNSSVIARVSHCLHETVRKLTASAMLELHATAVRRHLS